MNSVFLTAFGLGIALCIVPGIITAEATRRGLTGGFRAALLVELGSLVGDATWAVIALIGAAFLVQNAAARLLLGGVGTVLLLRLAWGALKAWYRPAQTETENTAARRYNGHFVTGVALSLANPQAIAFWLGVGGGMVATDLASPAPEIGQFALFFAGFMLAAFVWAFFIATLISFGRRFVTPQTVRWLNLICAVALGYFALDLLLNTLTLVTQ
ncbi:MAG: LysE family transporter [Burkholderiales bacterium]|nr:LysE family transporter [Anaerolineae bacterium]